MSRIVKSRDQQCPLIPEHPAWRRIAVQLALLACAGAGWSAAPVPALAPTAATKAAVSTPHAAPPVADPAPPAGLPVPSSSDSLLRAVLPPCTADGQPTPAPVALVLPEALEARRVLLQRGKCALYRGVPAEAEAIFRQGLAEDKELPRLWRMYLFAALKRQGKNVEALATLADTLKGATRAYSRQGVREILTEPEVLSSDPSPASAGTASVQTAEDVEFDYLATYAANVRLTADDYALTQRLLALATPRHDDALLRRLPVVLWRDPQDESAAQLGMSVLGADPKAGRGLLRGDDYAERERRLTELRLYGLVVLEIGDRALPALEPDAMRRLGRLYLSALVQQKDYRKAAELVDRGMAVQRFAFEPKENAIWAVRIALRRRNTQQVLANLKALEAIDPKTDALPGFYLELARQYDQTRDVGPMTEWCRRVIAASPGSNAAGTAYWMLVWNRYERHDLKGARDWAEKALASVPPVPWDYQARLLYWKGRIAAATGDTATGHQAWAELENRWPSTYYGLIAQSAGDDPEPAHYSKVTTRLDSAAEAPKLDAVWNTPALASALFAYAAGEDSLADALLQEALVSPLPKETVAELAALFLVLNEHHLQQRLMANQSPYELVTQPISEAPAWREAFPPAFWDLVVDEAGAEDVSPHFILAIMREESRFKVKADSRVGAKGLMQVMPSTALELARKRRINLSEATLLLPEFNIPIGALYLRDVLRRFDWNPIFAAAAYNAGPGAVMRWAKEWGEIPFDEFVERIPFDETQAYVRRVYSSYLIYRRLYP